MECFQFLFDAMMGLWQEAFAELQMILQSFFDCIMGFIGLGA